MHNQNSMENIIELVTEINLNNDCSFIADKVMKLNMRFDILNIIETCVDF